MHVSVYTMWKKQGKKEPESLLGHIIHNENNHKTHAQTHTHTHGETHTQKSYEYQTVWIQVKVTRGV